MRYLLVLTFAFAAGCAPKEYSLEQKKLYNLDTVVNSLGLIQNAAIGLEANKQITTGDTRLIVQFTVNALKVIKNRDLKWKDQLLYEITNLRESGLIPSLLDRFRDQLKFIELIIKEIQ